MHLLLQKTAAASNREKKILGRRKVVGTTKFVSTPLECGGLKQKKGEGGKGVDCFMF